MILHFSDYKALRVGNLNSSSSLVIINPEDFFCAIISQLSDIQYTDPWYYIEFHG